VIGGTYLLLVFSAIFFAWARAEGVHDDVAQPIRRPRPRPISDAPQAEQPASATSVTAIVNGTAAGPPTLPRRAPRRVAGSPTDLGARHVVTSAPDRSRLN